MIVATPGRLRAHLEAEPAPSFSLRHTSHVVLDEADLLFEDDDFELTWEALRRTLPSSASTCFVTATLPNWLIERAQRQLPLLRVLRGKTLHRTVPGVRETLIDCSAGCASQRRPRHPPSPNPSIDRLSLSRCVSAASACVVTATPASP